MGFLDKLFGDPNEKIINSIREIVDEINKLEEKYKKMGDDELQGLTSEFRKKIDIKDNDTRAEIDEKLNKILPDAFAAVRESSKRILNQRHFDVQLIGGVALHRGHIAEMRTGEGKTLVATLPLYLNALAGRGVHLVTVNDYLSRVGAGWMASIYHALGMTTGVIIHDTALIYDPEYLDDSQFDDRLKHFKPVPRREAYRCDILYGTNNEFGFDYLRDNMVDDVSQMAQRDLFYAIVDEVDSILIDEARTPLIISAPAEESTDKYFKFFELVSRLKENDDYNVDEKMRAVTLTDGGIAKMEKWLGVENIYTSGGVRDVHHIEQALKANVLFKKDKDYVVREGEVIIVDEFTGRLMHGRRYSEGLHQAIEAKEGVKVQRESETLATITFQNYFRMYSKLAGMTGTAVTEAEEFHKIYNLETLVIPTNKPMVRKDMNDLIYRTELGKFKAVINEIKRRSATGQPVLVGTISIEKNEILAEMLEREGIEAKVLNAKFHDKEAQIIAEAGKLGAVTIATNMAGRGVDIILGGPLANPGNQTEEEKKEHQKVLELGGLHVIGTERHEARRIDNQLRGRAGRQGDPGSSQFYISMEDDLMRIFGGERMKGIMATLKLPEDMPIENRIISKSIESAQRKVEANNFDIRKHLVEYDDVLNKHRETIYRRRREILDLYEKEKNISKEFTEEITLSSIILEMIENEIEQVVSFHTSEDDINTWNLDEIYQVASTIFPVDKKLKTDLSEFTKNQNKLDKVEARTAIIDHLVKLSKEKYAEMKNNATELGINWLSVEKSILIRSIDTLWIEHLEVMSSMRQGIGLRGYGQRDPLVEYKKEAYGLFNELNNLIQKEIVYSIFKVGDVSQFIDRSLLSRAKNFIAPAKTMEKGTSSFSNSKDNRNNVEALNKNRDKEGNKIGRNDPCPCGAKKDDGTPIKYKNCHGK